MYQLHNTYIQHFQINPRLSPVAPTGILTLPKFYAQFRCPNHLLANSDTKLAKIGPSQDETLGREAEADCHWSRVLAAILVQSDKQAANRNGIMK